MGVGTDCLNFSGSRLGFGDYRLFRYVEAESVIYAALILLADLALHALTGVALWRWVKS